MSSDGETRKERGFPLFVSTLALLVAFTALLAVAFKLNSKGDAATPTAAAPKAATAAPAETEKVSLVIKTDEEHGKLGPEGTWHDAYLPADFTVHPGATVEVTVRNYDEASHTFTSAGLGTNQMIAGGSATKPATTTFTFTAPTKKGSYGWHCVMPCDPWAMTHSGFMKGSVQVA
ncbi:MAG: cupredoxin domain-containing protein [Actinobacteria bacterium]|nr:cupredoxin domain-containing protein [Actinomycetota bacterium]